MTGLSAREASERLAAFGPNEPVAVTSRSVFRELGRRFTNPLVAILVVASIASAILRDFVDALIVLTIVGLSIAIEFVQTNRSRRAAEALKETVAQTSEVLRDATWQTLPRREVVPGDVVRVSAGDLVPADATLLEAKDLHVNEAALTGESLPVERRAGERISMGSSVVSGLASAEVVATGPRTAFGEIAALLAAPGAPTEFERGVTRFGTFILEMVVFLTLFVFVVTAVFRRDPLESLLFAVALAVGLTPEFLPMITTITLTRGALRMASANVIVKELAAIQNFGSIDVLCSDKTGTLTTGEMTLESHVTPFGESADRPLLLAYLNSYFESGVDNAIDSAVLRKARLDPLDSAVLRHEHPDIGGYTKVDEMPFDFERRRVSVVAARDGELILVAKGAPESILAVSTSFEREGKRSTITPEDRARIEQTSTQLGAAGYRVLGVAYASVESRASFSKDDEHDLVHAGFVTFVDPPRAGAREVLAELKKEGVRVKVVTGDSELVAIHLCEQVGISTKHALRGAEIDTMSDPALAHRADRAQLFSRVTPAQKSRILRAIQARGHVVGFLGDGINDAPSLHAADAGISVANAVDVAKDAADIILLEPGLDVLLRGILEGRRAFGNVMKYLLMGTSSNFGNMFSMAGATLVLPFLPMLPTQILLNNFLYDLAQVTIPSDNVDDHFVRKPRRWNIDLIRKFTFVIGPVSSIYDFLTFFVLLRVFHTTEAQFHTGWFVESLATQTLVIFVIRTSANPLRSRPSRALTLTTLLVVATGIVIPFLPGASAFGFFPLPAHFYAFLGVATVTYLMVVELLKRKLFRRSLA